MYVIIEFDLILGCEKLMFQLQIALKDKGIDSMLDDARKSSSETDAEFLKKS